MGFHGTSKDVAAAATTPNGSLIKSENVYDWLGHGIYFWEGSYERALQWAEDRHGKENAAVVGAVIKLGNCFDLLDTRCTEKLSRTYELLKSELQQAGEPLPLNESPDKTGIKFKRSLDCRVIMRYQDIIDSGIARSLNITPVKNNSYSAAERAQIQQSSDYIDSVRGMFEEGDTPYPDAGFRERNHLQICVRNPNCIIAYFSPRTSDPNYKKL